jgi:hypothetical protein
MTHFLRDIVRQPAEGKLDSLCGEEYRLLHKKTETPKSETGKAKL